MATLTLNYYEKTETPTGDISLVSTTSDACETVVVVDVNPVSGNKLVEFEVNNGLADITPPAGIISSLTQYTITIHGYQSLLPSANVTGTKAKIILKSEDGLTTIDSSSYVRGNVGSSCDDLTVDPGNGGGSIDPSDPNSCDECITDGGRLPGESDGTDFDNNGGFGYDDWGTS